MIVRRLAAALLLLLALVAAAGGAGGAALLPPMRAAAQSPAPPKPKSHPHAHTHPATIAPRPRALGPRVDTSMTYQVTLTTDTANDANCLPAGMGDCTLRQAINAADGNDPGTGVNTITFAANVTGAITLDQTFGPLIVAAFPLTITGPGQTVLAIDGGCTAGCGTATPTGGVPVLLTDPTTAPALTVTDLTIRNGVVTSPGPPGISGGLTTYGPVTLTNVTVSGNSTLGNQGFGGGMLLTYCNCGSAPIATLAHVTATGNYAGDFAGGIEIDDLGQLPGGAGTLTDLVATGNTSGRDVGGIGIENLGVAVGITLTNNTAMGFYGGMAIDNTTTITNLTATGNYAVMDGGGVAVETASTLINVTITNNTAGRDVAGLLVEDATTITNLTVTGNLAGRDAGGLYYDYLLTLTGATISGNTAVRDGGGVYSDDDNLFTNVTITNNTARRNGGGYYGDNYVRNNRVFTGLTITGNMAGGNGGGFSDSFVSVVVNATVAHNTAAGSGGGIYLESTPVTSQSFGGPATLALAASTVSDNTANLGGGIALNFLSTATPPTATLNDALVAGNHLAGTAPSGPDLYDTTGSAFTGTYDLIGDGTGQGGGALTNGGGNNRVGTTAAPITPLLAPLGAYGATNGAQTLALLPGSAAIDTGTCPAYTTKPLQKAITPTTNPFTVTTDARGTARPQGAACDVGSFETNGFTLTGNGNQSAGLGQPFANPLSVTVAPVHAGDPVVGGVIAFILTPGTASATFAASGGSSCTVGGANLIAGCVIPAGGVTNSPTVTAGTGAAGTLTASAGAAGASNAAFTLTVTRDSSSTAVTALPNPATVGQSVTLTATVTTTATGVGTPTGTVTFTSGGTPLGSGTLMGGIATTMTTALPVGMNQTITATYNGDPTFATSSGTTTETVNMVTTTTSVTAMPNPGTQGSGVTLTATVTTTATGVGTPTGTVTFTSGGTPLGSVSLTNGIATTTTTALPVGMGQTITATYGGDPTFAGSVGTTTETVNPAPLALIAPTGNGSNNGGTAAAPSIRAGTALPLTAQLQGMTATGVTYTSNNANVASVNPTTGVVTGIAPGTAIITANGPNGSTGTITVTVTGGTGGGLVNPNPQPMAHATAPASTAPPAAQPGNHTPSGTGSNGTGTSGLQPQTAGSPSATPDAQPARR